MVILLTDVNPSSKYIFQNKLFYIRKQSRFDLHLRNSVAAHHRMGVMESRLEARVLFRYHIIARGDEKRPLCRRGRWEREENFKDTVINRWALKCGDWVIKVPRQWGVLPCLPAPWVGRRGKKWFEEAEYELSGRHLGNIPRAGRVIKYSGRQQDEGPSLPRNIKWQTLHLRTP